MVFGEESGPFYVGPFVTSDTGQRAERVRGSWDPFLRLQIIHSVLFFAIYS